MKQITLKVYQKHSGIIVCELRNQINDAINFKVSSKLDLELNTKVGNILIALLNLRTTLR